MTNDEFRSRAFARIRQLQERVAELEATSAEPPSPLPDYVVIPRNAIERMPESWQGRLNRLLGELSQELGWPTHLPEDCEYQVRLRDRRHSRMVSLAFDPLSTRRNGEE